MIYSVIVEAYKKLHHKYTTSIECKKYMHRMLYSQTHKYRERKNSSNTAMTWPWPCVCKSIFSHRAPLSLYISPTFFTACISAGICLLLFRIYHFVLFSNVKCLWVQLTWALNHSLWIVKSVFLHVFVFKQ